MRGASPLGVGAILKIRVRNPGIRSVAQGPEIVESEHQSPAIEVFSRVRQIDGSGQGEVVGDVRVGIVHLFGKVMAADIFIQLESRSRLVGEGVFIERSFESNKAGGQIGIEDEIQVTALQNALSRTKEKNFVLHDRSAEIGGGIPAIEKGRAGRGGGDVVGVEYRVPEKGRYPAVPVIGAAPGDNVNDPSGGVTEFRLVSARDDLKLEN